MAKKPSGYADGQITITIGNDEIEPRLGDAAEPVHTETPAAPVLEKARLKELDLLGCGKMVAVLGANYLCECEYSCGFQGSFQQVAAHEEDSRGS